MRKLFVLLRIKILGKSTVVCKLIELSLSLQGVETFGSCQLFQPPFLLGSHPLPSSQTLSPLYTPFCNGDDLRSKAVPFLAFFFYLFGGTPPLFAPPLLYACQEIAAVFGAILRRTFEKRFPRYYRVISGTRRVDRRVKILFYRRTCINFVAVAGSGLM